MVSCKVGEDVSSEADVMGRKVEGCGGWFQECGGLKAG